MISKEKLAQIIEKHFYDDFAESEVDYIIKELSIFSGQNESVVNQLDMLQHIYACFIYKELDFTLTVGLIKKNYTVINEALKELRLDYENCISNVLCFTRNLSGIVLTHKKIKFHYWTKDPINKPFEINTISYKLINPAKDLGIDLGKFRIFINAETMLNCLKDIEAEKVVDVFDMPYSEIITRPAKDLESNPFSSIIDRSNEN